MMNFQVAWISPGPNKSTPVAHCVLCGGITFPYSSSELCSVLLSLSNKTFGFRNSSPFCARVCFPGENATLPLPAKASA
jgi:hypothetical protein